MLTLKCLFLLTESCDAQRAYSSNMKVCQVRWPQCFFGFPLNQIKIANNDSGPHALQLLALALSVGAD